MFVYSDINFVVLGALVERLSGESLDEYAARHVFEPLGMKETRFLPPPWWHARIAPTEEDENHHLLRGVVHDPTARRMGGVAGDAGVFSTADDVAIFAQALLDGGRGVLTPATVAKMTAPQQPVNGNVTSRIWVGHRFSVFDQPWRAAAGRWLRTYWIHGHIALDRSNNEDLYRTADERGALECAAEAKGKRGIAAHQGCDGGGGGAGARSRGS